MGARPGSRRCRVPSVPPQPHLEDPTASRAVEHLRYQMAPPPAAAHRTSAAATAMDTMEPVFASGLLEAAEPDVWDAVAGWAAFRVTPDCRAVDEDAGVTVLADAPAALEPFAAAAALSLTVTAATAESVYRPCALATRAT